MENVARAIVEMAALIKKPEELFAVADELGKRFKLSDEEIDRRNSYNSLIAEGEDLKKNLTQKEKSLAAKEEELNAFKEVLESNKAAFFQEKESHETSQQSVIDGLKLREASAVTKENALISKEKALSDREQGIVAKENELRVREADIFSREEKMKKVVEAMS